MQKNHKNLFHSFEHYSTHTIFVLFRKKSSAFFLLLFLMTLLCMQYSYALAAPRGVNNSSENNLPIKVTSDDMLYDMEKNTVDFKGNVVAVRGDFVLYAPLMTIYMLKDDAKKEEPTALPQNTPLTGRKPDTTPSMQDDNNIEKITASHGVHFTYGTQSGSSDSAVYIAKTGVLTMYGDPIVRDGENQIQGETIRYYINENRSEVVGSGQKRVEAIFKK